MTICCVSGENTQQYLLTEATHRVASGFEIIIVDSKQDTFKDYKALGRPVLTTNLTQILRNTIRLETKTPTVIVFPDLSAPTEAFYDLIQYIKLSSNLPIDILIGISESEATNMFDALATSKVIAGATTTQTEIPYTYVDRGTVNDAIYTALRKRRDNK